MASPMSNSESFLDMHQNFVLKLKFVGEGDTSQIRRVRLPRIAKDGNVSYEELVGLAISLVVDSENPQNFEVKLTYQDVDDDTVVIGSSEELMDAIDQFSGQRLLRLTAEVKRCTRAKPQEAHTHSSPSRASPERANASTNNAATQAGNHGPAPVLQHVVESVVDIILKAAVAVNGHGRAASSSSSSSHPYYTPEGVPTASSEAAVAPSPAESEAAAEARNKVEEPKDNLKSPPVEKSSDTKPAPTMAEVPADAAENPATEEAAETEAEENEERPFIHGRHTCDACLTTPIVGKRYHAVNMADYDLCEKCFTNYKGAEIRFEATELDRDRQLQDRWHRRRNRMNGNANRRFGPPGHHKRWGPGCGPRGGRGPHGPHGPGKGRGCRGQQGPRSLPVPSAPHGGPTVCPAHPNNAKKEDDDLAMDLAIRRSLEDLMLNSEEKPKNDVEPSAPVEEEVAETASPEDADTVEASDVSNGSSETEGDKGDEVEEESTGDKFQDEPETEGTEKEDVSSVDPAVSAASNSTSSSAKKNESLKDVTGFRLFSREERLKIRQDNSAMSLDELQKAVEDKWDALSDEEREEYKKLSTLVEVRVPSDVSFASGISVIKGEEAQEKKEPTLEDLGTSFSTDAAGNGDVADLLGSTLDKCAQAIDAMVSELDRTPSNDESDSDSSASSFVGVEGEDVDSDEDAGAVKPTSEDETAVAENTVAEETDGATIVEPNDSVKDENKEATSFSEERGEEGWQVVTEDHQINGDEELARAAQMVGSALFNSDMRSSGEIMSTLTGSAGGSEAFSYASSVPTSVHSITSVPSAQLQRWAAQLAQLHQMGFDDDAACVEILERLTAANIGVDSTDEISVEQVVNELWRS